MDAISESKPPTPPSILVLTKDEQVNIASCLERLAFSDDIVVLDSYSSDRTCEIASQFPNVRVIQRPFDTWSNHSNWALKHIEFKHQWVYYSDADEHVTPELRDEILRVINDASNEYAAFQLRYKNMFMGKWLRHGGIYPVWITRLFRPNRIHYEDRQVNAHPVVDGKTGQLKEHFIHYSFNKGLVPWLRKHNRYSQMEAVEAVRVTQQPMGSYLKQLCRATPGERRRILKNLSFFLPVRAVARLLYMAIIKRGFLDGRAGLRYALMISMYEYWIELKMREQVCDWGAESQRQMHRLLEESA